MHWVLQQNLFAEEGWTTLVDTLARFNIPYSVHKVVPFVGELLPDVHPSGNVICFGSYSMRHIAKARNWYPGVFDLEPFDFRQQCNHWGEHMLNFGAKVSTFEAAVFDEPEYFVRPIHDSKHFAGKVFDQEDFVSWQTSVCKLKLDYGNSLNNDTLIQMCPIRKILREYRFWVVKGEIVTASLYKIGWTIHYQSEVEQRYYDYVKERIAEWQPLEAFVIDVCDTPDGIKIVEINTINSSGFYAGDMQKLVFAMEENFGDLK